MSNSILFSGGEVFLPDGLNHSDVLVEDGTIKKIGQQLDAPSAEKINIENKILLPGVIDSQVHFREPGATHKEDLHTGSKAAAMGGVTTFLDMPNNHPSITTCDLLKQKLAWGGDKSLINFGFFIGATADNVSELVKAEDLPGCCGIKIFLGSSTGDLLLYEASALSEIFKNTSMTISCHSENEKMLQERREIMENATSAHTHPEWRDVQTAFSSTERLIGIAEECGRKVHILHLTSAEEMKFLTDKKDQCTVEVTPQHLTLHAPECYDYLGNYAKMNPPIRAKNHLQALWEGIENKTVDIIGSDHAPHTRQEKDKPYPQAPAGMPGVQTLLPIMLNHVNNNMLNLDRLVELVCVNPARIFFSKK